MYEHESGVTYLSLFEYDKFILVLAMSCFFSTPPSSIKYPTLYIPWQICLYYIFYIIHIYASDMFYFNNTFSFKPVFDNCIVYLIIILLLSPSKFGVIFNLIVFTAHTKFFSRIFYLLKYSISLCLDITITKYIIKYKLIYWNIFIYTFLL